MSSPWVCSKWDLVIHSLFPNIRVHRDIFSLLSDIIRTECNVIKMVRERMPSLSTWPSFHFIGLGGSPRLIDVGGVPNLIPLPDKSKQYNLAEVARLAELPGAFLLGAGAGSSRVAGVNCEVRNCVYAQIRSCECGMMVHHIIISMYVYEVMQ